MGEVPSGDLRHKDQETLIEGGRRMVRCCLSVREEDRTEEHCCWIGHGEVLACEETSGGVQGSSREGQGTYDRWGGAS